jgi:hypothetical protein
MAVDVPNTPTNGQVMTVGGRSWTYNSTTATWDVTAGAAGGGAGTSDLFLLGGM